MSLLVCKTIKSQSLSGGARMCLYATLRLPCTLCIDGTVRSLRRFQCLILRHGVRRKTRQPLRRRSRR